MHILEIDKNGASRELSDSLPSARYEGIQLSPDKQGLYYARYEKTGTLVFYHQLGSPASGDNLIVTVGRGELAKLRTNTTLKEPLIAPLAAGAALGELTVTAPNGDVVIRTPLVALQADPLGGIWTRMTDSISLWFK